MFPNTPFTKLAGIQYPIVGAPMVGAWTTDLTVAISNAGGLGPLAAAAMTPETIRKEIAEIRKRTGKPFNVNLFVLGDAKPDGKQVARALELLAPIREELGLPPGTPPEKYAQDTAAQIEAVIEARPAMVSFTFGIISKEQVASLKARGILVMGTATTVAEARAWEAVGADAVCAQGSEAGGHRGTFLGDFEGSLVGTIALVPQVVDAVRVPVVAAGGIMDGRGIAAAMMLGASAAQLGTAFLSSPESGIPTAWREALRDVRDDSTRVSRIYSGRYARGIVNEFMRKLTPVVNEVPPYPIQNALTQQIRQAAAKAGRAEYLSLWAGQAAAMGRGLPAAGLFAALVRETQDVLKRATSSVATDEGATLASSAN